MRRDHRKDHREGDRLLEIGWLDRLGSLEVTPSGVVRFMREKTLADHPFETSQIGP